MRILLTGASSELGRRLYRRLKKDPRLSGAVFLLLRHNRALEADAGDEILDGSLEALPPLEGVEAVVHLASVSHSRDPRAYERVNLDGTKSLLEALAVCPVKQFVYVSSRCLGESGGAYSRSKALAEEAVRSSGLPFTIFRPAEIIGEQYGRGITQFVELARRWRIFPVLLSSPPVTVAPIDLDDAVEAVARAVLLPACAGKTYTLAGPREYAFTDVWRSLPWAVCPIPVPVALLRAACAAGLGAPDQVERLLLRKSCDSAEASRDLGFKPRPLEELLHG